MSLPPAQLAGLIVAEDAIIYNTVAASVFFFWDHCITFDEEESWVELIWRQKWSLVNIMFVVVRYMTLLNRIIELVFYTNVAGLIHPSMSNCAAWLRYEAASGQIIFLCVEILLIMRVYAFYGRKRILLAVILTLFLCESSARIIILGRTIPKMVIVPNTLPPSLHAGACLVEWVPELFLNYWVPGLIFESVLFVLVVARFVQTKRQAEMDCPPVLIILVRDGTWAFMMIFAVLMWSTLSFELTPIKGDVALTWLFSILGFCGSRLVLNLRSAAAQRTPVTEDEGLELNFHIDSVVEIRTRDSLTAGRKSKAFTEV